VLTAMVVVKLEMRKHRHTSVPVESDDTQALTSQQPSEELTT
jgi:hypothetical protein